MPRDDNAWKLRASTPFIYESKENIVQKFIHGGRSKATKSSGTSKPTSVPKKTDNTSSLKSQTFTSSYKTSTNSATSTFKSKTCNFDAGMSTEPITISHKYYQYITDANAKYNFGGYCRKFKPTVPTITCKPQTFVWNYNMKQQTNTPGKGKNENANLKTPQSPPPPPTPIPYSSRYTMKKQHVNLHEIVAPIKTDYVKQFDENLSPTTLGLIRKMMKNRSKNKNKSPRRVDSESDSALEECGIYINGPSTSTGKPKTCTKKKPPQQKSCNKDCNKDSTKMPVIKRTSSATKVSSNTKFHIPRVMIMNKPSNVSKNINTHRAISKQQGPSHTQKASGTKERFASIKKERRTKD